MENRHKTRCLTVGSTIHERLDIDNRHVPKIRLIGLWIEKAGFKIGDKLTVDIEPNRLLLNRIEPEPLPPVPEKKTRRKRHYL
ncbi:SymE family type I addiction module toxin [Chitinophaga sp. ARDCPP14]|jgi:hypothetical protein|uniref:SymE family type I addiction module toxin n=1 Tax=Chitinophaga sp. ARDCPP14 TaxID=3391139 RepID=UPI003F5268BE